MKTISKRFLKGGLAVLLAVIMLFSSCITGFAAVVDVADTSYDFAANTPIYFDATGLGWPSNYKVEFMVGHNTWSATYEMTKIANTNLYYLNHPSWGGATQFCIIANSSAWGDEGSSPSNRRNYASYKTPLVNMTGNYSGTFQMYVSGSTLKTEWLGNGTGSTSYNYMDANQTAHVYAAAAGSTSYSANASAGTVKVSGYHMTAASGTSANSASSTLNSTSSATVSLARSSTVTLTATPAAGYNFVGWFDSTSSTATAVSTNTTYTYTQPGSTKTYYARFQQAGYSYTISAGTGGSVSPSGTGTGTSVDVTATPANGYKFNEWVTSNGAVANTTATSTTFTPSASGATCQATFTPADYTVTLNADGGTINSGNVTGYTYGDTVTLPTNVTKTGYTFQGWKDDATGSTVTSITSTTYGNKSYTAQWKINAYTITVNQNVAGGTTKIGSATISGTTGSAQFDYGSTVTVTVTPTGNYKISAISGAISNGESTSAVTKTFTVTGDATINVNYVLAGSCSVSFASNATKELVIGETYTNTASVDTYCTGNKSVAYSSNATSVATVNANGVVTAVAPGTATITAKCPTDNSSASYQVTVLEPTLAYGDITLDVNGTADADDYRTITNTPKSSYNVTYTAISSGDVRITTAGAITAMAPTTGVNVTAKITAGSWSKTVTFPVKVNDVTLNFNPKAVNLLKGQTMTQAFTASANVGDPTITITSDDTDVMTLANNKGTAVKAGSTTVTATFAFNNYYKPTATSNVLVSDPVVELPEGFTSLALEFGGGTTEGTVQLSTNAEFSDVEADPVTVTTANADVATATIDGDTITVTATGTGTTTITAKFHDAEVEIPVTVTQYDPYVYLYITNNQGFDNLYIYSWKGSGTQVTPVDTPMVYIGKNGDGDKLFAYKFLKTNVPEKFIITQTGAWGGWQTGDIAVNWNTYDHRAFYFSSANSGTGMGDWTSACMIVRPTVSVDNVTVNVNSTATATATAENAGVIYWTSDNENIATVADVTTYTTTVTGVAADTTTITARAFIDTANSSIKTLPTNYKTDTACWDFISSYAQATVNVSDVTCSVDVSAAFTNNGTEYTVGETGGTATADKTEVSINDSVTLTATPAPGYRFVGWFASVDDETALPVGEDGSYKVTDPNTTLVAKFIKTYTITANESTGIDSYTVNDDTYTEPLTVLAGSDVTVVANVADGYKLKDWTVNGEIYEYNEVSLSDIDCDVTLIANAVPVKSATATAITRYPGDTAAGGTVKVNGNDSPYLGEINADIEFTATPDNTFAFKGWYSDADCTKLVSADATYTAKMTESGIDLYALFVKVIYIVDAANENNVVELEYDVETDRYTATDDYYNTLKVCSFVRDYDAINAENVTVIGDHHTGVTVSGDYNNGYTLTPDLEEYDPAEDVTYTLVANADKSYTLYITLQPADKVAIYIDGKEVAKKAVGTTYSGAITPPAGQYLYSVAVTPTIEVALTDNNISFVVPDEDVYITSTFKNYSYVEFTDITGLTLSGNKPGYKAGESVTITVSPQNGGTTIKNITADYDGAEVTNDADVWTITIASMPEDTTVTVTPDVIANFSVKAQQVALGNYGTDVTNFGVVSVTDADGNTVTSADYVAPGTEVTFSATAATNYIFDGFYSDEDCTLDNLLSRDEEYTTTVTKDTTIYVLFARKQWMTYNFQQTGSSYAKELTYNKEERIYIHETTLAANESTTTQISKTAWFLVSNTNSSSAWTDSKSYHIFDGNDFSVSHNAKGYNASIRWPNENDKNANSCWILDASANANGSTIKFILTPFGNTGVDFSAQVGDPTGDAVYLSSGRLDIATADGSDVFSAVSEFTDTTATFTDKTVKNGDTVVENYKLRALDKPQTVSFKTTISGTMKDNYVIDKFVVYHANEQKYSIIDPNPIGNNAYTGSVYAEGPCYIVPIYHLTSEYAEANGLVEIDIYFDATAIMDHSWGPFVACYAWGAGVDFFGAWSGQLMIPTEDGSSFYTMLTVPTSDAAEGKPHGVTFNNYMANTVPGANPGAMGVTAMTYQTYDYREPLSLYEDGYEVITFVAKDSTDGYHGDEASAKNATANTVTDAGIDLNDYHFDYLYARDGVTPMDLNHNEIENPADLTTTKADYYIVTRGDVPYGECYVGDGEDKKEILNTSEYGGTGYQGDWSVDWYVFNSNGEYIGHTLSAAYWDDTTNDLEDGVNTVLLETLGLTADAVAGKTVAISYEHENNDKDNTHQISYDGQWYGNMLSDMVDANVIVGLKGNDGEFVIDTEDPVNEALYGCGYLVEEGTEELKGSVQVTMDYGEVNLTATPEEGFYFVGWYTYVRGRYVEISASPEYNTYINMNTTYYAIFKQLGDNEVVINHMLYNNPKDAYIPSHGGAASMLVEVYLAENGEAVGEPFAAGSVSTAKSTVVFEPDPTKEYVVKIYTTPLMDGSFFAWYTDSEDANGNATYEEILTTAEVVNQKTEVTAEFIYSPLETEQRIINIYSDVKRTSSFATIYYKYFNRNDEIRTYTVTDVPLTDDECNGYEGTTMNSIKYTYCPTFVTRYDYVDETGQVQSVFSEEEANKLMDQGYDVTTHNTIQENAPLSTVTEAIDQTVSWIVTGVKLDISESYVTVWADQKIDEFTLTVLDAEGEIVDEQTGPYNTLATNIEAAKTDANGAPFSYWIDKNTEEIVSYMIEYNYRIVENKTIKPVYGATFDAWTPVIDSVTYTREYQDTSDYVYSDFLITFNSATGEELDELKAYDDSIRYGLVMVREQGYMYEGTNTGVTHVQYPDPQALDGKMEDAVSRILSTGKNVGIIGNDDKNYLAYNYDLTAYESTNFNRMEYYIRYNNLNENNRKYAFQAYVYLVIDNKTYISKPVEVNIFDAATAPVTM